MVYSNKIGKEQWALATVFSMLGDDPGGARDKNLMN